MTARQLLWPEAGVWVGRDEAGLSYRMPGRSGSAPGIPVLPLIGPVSAGGPVLWLDVQATLTGAGPWAHPLRGVVACASDPQLLTAVLSDRVLLLIGSERSTSVTLPALPRALAALGGEDSGHCLLGFSDEVYALRWQDNRISTELLACGMADSLILLSGDPPAAVLRSRAPDADRLELFLFRATPWARWWPLPPLLLEPGTPLAVRQEASGLLVQVQSGRWLRYHLGAWQEAPGAITSGVPTFRYGGWAAIGPESWFEKERIPSPAKLALARHRQTVQEHIAQGRLPGAQGNIVSRPEGR